MLQVLASLLCRACWAERTAYYRKWWHLAWRIARARSEEHPVRERELRAELARLIAARQVALEAGHD